MESRGELFVYAGSTGGFWVFLQGIFSVYIDMMSWGKRHNIINDKYHLIGEHIQEK